MMHMCAALWLQSPLVGEGGPLYLSIKDLHAMEKAACL